MEPGVYNTLVKTHKLLKKGELSKEEIAYLIGLLESLLDMFGEPTSQVEREAGKPWYKKVLE